MDEDARFDLLRRLFALITAEAEDAAAAAADGQGRDVPDDRLYELANKLHAAGETIAVISDAVIAIPEAGRRRPPLIVHARPATGPSRPKMEGLLPSKTGGERPGRFWALRWHKLPFVQTPPVGSYAPTSVVYVDQCPTRTCRPFM